MKKQVNKTLLISIMTFFLLLIYWSNIKLHVYAAEVIPEVTTTSGTATYENGNYKYTFSYTIGDTSNNKDNEKNTCTVTKITIDSGSKAANVPLNTSPKVKYSVSGTVKSFVLRPTAYGDGTNTVVENNSSQALTALRLYRYTEKINANAFKNLSSLESAYAYYSDAGNNFSSLKHIGDNAFYDLRKLKRFGANDKRINIPATCTYIGNNAFYYAGYSYAVGDGVTVINIGSTSDTTIGNNAFYKVDSAATVTIGTGVTSIGTEAFFGCPVNTTLNWNAINCTTYNNAFTNKYTATVAIGSSVTHIPANFIQGNTAVTSITIPDSTTHIYSNAFNGCTSLVTLTIGTGTQNIGTDAFKSAPLTTKITMNATNLTSHSDALNNKTTKAIAIGTGVTQIPSRLFYGCTLTSTKTITIPKVCTSIGDYAFYNMNSITGLTFTATATCKTIGNYAFSGCSGLTALTVPISVTSIGSNAFSGCSSIATVTFTKTSAISSIGDYAFSGCTAITNIKGDGTNNTFPASLRTIGQHAFDGCTGLTTLNYGASGLYSIGSHAFYGCTSLVEFTDGTEGGMAHLNTQITYLGDHAFSNSGIYNIRVLNTNVGGAFASNQNIRCFSGSIAETKAKASGSHVITIYQKIETADTANKEVQYGDVVAKSSAAQHNELFSRIGRFKIDYTGASSYYYETDYLKKKSRSVLGLNNIEYNHSSSHLGSSSGAKLNIPSNSVLRAAFLIYEPDIGSSNVAKIDSYYTTLSYSATKKTSGVNLVPTNSIEFKPTKLMYGSDENTQAYIDVTDFVIANGEGYYYVSNIPHLMGTGDTSASWKIVYVLESGDFPLKAVVVVASHEHISSASGDGWKYSGKATITLPIGLYTKNSGNMDLIYGISNSDTFSGVNKVQYYVGDETAPKTADYISNPDVTYNGYYIRSTNIPCRLVFTRNGVPVDQIRSIDTGEYYLDYTLLTAEGTKSTFTQTATSFPVTGSDAELMTIPVEGGNSNVMARVGANGKVLVLNTLAIASDIEGFEFQSTQSISASSSSVVTITGTVENTTVDAYGEVATNIGITNGEVIVAIDPSLNVTGAYGTLNNGSTSTITGYLEWNDKLKQNVIKFSQVNLINDGQTFSYTVTCSPINNCTASRFNTQHIYSGNYYNNEKKTDYIEYATSEDDYCTPKYTVTIVPDVTSYAAPEKGTYDGSSSNQVFTDYYGNSKSLSTPVKKWYKFSSWKKSDGTTTTSMTHTYRKNETLTATYTLGSYTVTYNANGGSGSMTSQTLSYLNPVNIKANEFTKTDHIFLGWNTSPLGTGTKYEVGSEYYDDVNLTLYAQWGKAHTLTIQPNGGNWGGTTADSTFEMARGQTKEIPIPKKEGYKFTSWTRTDGTAEYDDWVVIAGRKYVCVDFNYNNTGNALYIAEASYMHSTYKTSSAGNNYPQSIVYSNLNNLGNTLHSYESRVVQHTISGVQTYAFALSRADVEKYKNKVNLKKSWTSDTATRTLLSLGEDTSPKPTGAVYTKINPSCGHCGAEIVTLQFGTDETTYPRYYCRNCKKYTYLITDTDSTKCSHDDAAITHVDGLHYICGDGEKLAIYACPSCNSPKTTITELEESTFKVKCNDCTSIYKVEKPIVGEYMCTRTECNSNTNVRYQCLEHSLIFVTSGVPVCPQCKSAGMHYAPIVTMGCSKCGSSQYLQKISSSSNSTVNYDYNCLNCDSKDIYFICGNYACEVIGLNMETCRYCGADAEPLYCYNCGQR